jgi:hypothetical protein
LFIYSESDRTLSREEIVIENFFICIWKYYWALKVSLLDNAVKMQDSWSIFLGKQELILFCYLFVSLFNSEESCNSMTKLSAIVTKQVISWIIKCGISESNVHKFLKGILIKSRKSFIKWPQKYCFHIYVLDSCDIETEIIKISYFAITIKNAFRRYLSLSSIV